jgi:hypothetical protein
MYIGEFYGHFTAGKPGVIQGVIDDILPLRIRDTIPELIGPFGPRTDKKLPPKAFLLISLRI